ncbi:MAG: NRDE family protein [Bacteroidetes bacterium]|nr:MAG: NRDE family protein [Bacteroidota bacterium]
MCTVTFIPSNDKFFITTNRDEKFSRKTAIPPGIFEYNGQKLFFPKDADAGGTWIVMKENGDAAVLLNGAFICHTAEPPYRLSRGIILLDIFSTEKPSVTFSKINLQDIEPFTLVLLENNCLYEFRWDGTEKFCKQLDVNMPYIWSSATLYDGFVIKKREKWFTSFLLDHPTLTQQDILDFHRFTGDGDKRNDLLMTRDGMYTTVSITSILLTKNRGCIEYLDIRGNTSSEIKIELLQSSQTIE